MIAQRSQFFEMTTAATTQNCAMFHKRFSEILKTSLFKILQNVVTFYQFRATSLQFEQSRKNMERIVHRRTKLCKLFCDCTNCKDVARIGRRLQRFVQYCTNCLRWYKVVQSCTIFKIPLKTLSKHCTIVIEIFQNKLMYPAAPPAEPAPVKPPNALRG